MASNNVNDVFFFGAGFSKSLIKEYPLLSELSKKFQENNMIRDDEKQYQDNIEHLLTYLIAPFPFKNEIQRLKNEASYNEKIEFLVEYFKQLQSQYSLYQLKDNEVIGQVANYIHKNKSPCITLNYDLILEDMLEQYSSDYMDFYKMPIARIQDRKPQDIPLLYDSGETKEYPEIIKLHGSINWLYNQNFPQDRIYFDNVNEEILKSDLSPFIVPPILDKQNLYNHNIIPFLWKRSYQFLKNAKNIYIYGFSFPATDLSIRFLFQSALAKNKNCYKIYVINTDNDDTKKRYEEIFGKCKCDFSMCVKENQIEKLANLLASRDNTDTTN